MPPFFYRAERINDRVTAIRSLSGEILYLVHGDDRAILIDAGLGVKGLREFVETLTDKPVTVLLTHGHLDHAMGAPEFEDVYLNALDTDIYQEMSGIRLRQEYIAMAAQEPLTFLEEDFVQPFPVSLKDLRDGDVFDAGGIHVEAYHFAGHTPGMTALLIREERILVLGDGCNQATFLFDGRAASVEEYRDNISALISRTEGKLDHVYSSHRTIELPVGIMLEAVELCGEIMEGDTDDVPFEFLGHTAHLAKQADEKFNRLDGGIFNLVYNKARVFRTQELAIPHP